MRKLQKNLRGGYFFAAPCILRDYIFWTPVKNKAPQKRWLNTVYY